MDAERIRLTVAPDNKRQQVAEYLATQVGWLSRIALLNLVKRGCCEVNGEVAGLAARVSPGDEVTITLDRQTPNAMTAEPLDLEVVFEDEHLLVVNKPAGMLVHPTKGVKTGTLANGLTWHLNPALREGERPEIGDAVIRPGFPHRLDQETSGLLVAGKTRKALQKLAALFAQREVGKWYLAVTVGWADEESGLIDQPIRHFPRETPHWQVHPQGKPASTRFTVKTRASEAALLELEPVTGRTNQLRAHCGWRGYPILGDEFYAAPPAPRLMLHAWRLQFRHPLTGEGVDVRSDAPPEFQAALRSV